MNLNKEFYVLTCSNTIYGFRFQIFDYLALREEDESIGPPGRGYEIVPTDDIQRAHWFGSRLAANMWLETNFPVAVGKFEVSCYKIIRG